MPEVDYDKLWPDCPVEVRHLTQDEVSAPDRDKLPVPSEKITTRSAKETTQSA
jgi:hypothetical protein